MLILDTEIPVVDRYPKDPRPPIVDWRLDPAKLLRYPKDPRPPIVD